MTMSDANRFLDDTRIASPCKASWDQMTGNNTVRFCGECKLNVYNISNMVATDAAALIARSDGGICVRLYRRKDGTVLTQDCPVGLRAAIGRATKVAGMALTAVLGLCSGVFSGSANARTAQDETNAQVEMGDVAKPEQTEEPHVLMGKIAIRHVESVTVAVADGHGAPVLNAEVVLTDLRTGDFVVADSDGDGTYRFQDVEPGIYTLTATAEGYQNPLPRTLRIRNGKTIETRIVLGEHAIPLMGGVAPRKTGRR